MKMTRVGTDIRIRHNSPHHRSDRNPSIMNIVHVLILFAILLKCVIASADDVASDVIKVVDRKKFEEIRRGWEHWRGRKDLFNYVITKSIDFIVEFIRQIYDSKRRILEALFDKKPELVDEVLQRITYDDDDLLFWQVTDPGCHAHSKSFSTSLVR